MQKEIEVLSRVCELVLRVEGFWIQILWWKQVQVLCLGGERREGGDWPGREKSRSENRSKCWISQERASVIYELRAMRFKGKGRPELNRSHFFSGSTQTKQWASRSQVQLTRINPRKTGLQFENRAGNTRGSRTLTVLERGWWIWTNRKGQNWVSQN